MSQFRQGHGVHLRRLTLGLSYLFFLAQVANIYIAVAVSDERYLDGADLDLFGIYWPVALLATLVIIVWLHIALISKQRRSYCEPPPDTLEGRIAHQIRAHRKLLLYTSLFLIACAASIRITFMVATVLLSR